MLLSPTIWNINGRVSRPLSLSWVGYLRYVMFMVVGLLRFIRLKWWCIHAIVMLMMVCALQLQFLC